ncbi:hypothetical protein ACLBXX_12075 [Microbacterium sp. C23T]
MRRSLPLALAALAVIGFLTACAPTAEPGATSTPGPVASADPTPTPTPTVQTIGGGQAPPAVFGGDCAVAVPAAELTAATGIDGIEIVRRDQTWTRTVDNVGGLVCEWKGGGVTGNVTILPKNGLDGAALPDDGADFYFGPCEWECSWRWESPELVIMGHSSDLAERGRVEADRIGAHVGAGIAARTADAGLSWQRDRERWWPRETCADLAVQLGSRMGSTVTAQEAGYHDPPSPGTVLADIASRRAWCGFETAGHQFAVAVFESGVAWGLSSVDPGQPVDLGVPGVQAFSSTQGGGYLGEEYVVTDGVNAMSVVIAPDSGWAPHELAAVFAATFVAP